MASRLTRERTKNINASGKCPGGRANSAYAELADYKTHVAERYVPFSTQAAFEKEVMHRLERIEDKLDAQIKAFASGLGGARKAS